MSESSTVYAGGCLCGALRYEARGEPLYAGHCYCADCRKALFHPTAAIFVRGRPSWAVIPPNLKMFEALPM